MANNPEDKSLVTEFSSLVSKICNGSGLDQLFGLAFVFSVETGFIPISLANCFDSVNRNIKLAKMINDNNQPLNTFWNKNNNVYTAQLIMSNELCHLTGVPLYNSLIITLSHSNTSKCTILSPIPEWYEMVFSNERKIEYEDIFIKYKNEVSVPIKCTVLDTTIGQYPNLCGIPEELVINIMTKLNSPHLYALMRSCKKMYDLAMNNQIIWKKLAIKYFKMEVKRDQDLNKCITDWRRYFNELLKSRSVITRNMLHKKMS